MSESLRIVTADFANPRHALALVRMLDAYAQDPMGGGQGLSAYAQANLVAEISKIAGAFSLLVFDGETEDLPVGLANCFQGFSTFACRPLINVHDLVVAAAYRRRGVGERLLAAVEVEAMRRGACKITLEVLSGNGQAMRLYERSGFAEYVLDPAAGEARFMQKWLQ